MDPEKLPSDSSRVFAHGATMESRVTSGRICQEFAKLCSQKVSYHILVVTDSGLCKAGPRFDHRTMPSCLLRFCWYAKKTLMAKHKKT